MLVSEASTSQDSRVIPIDLGTHQRLSRSALENASNTMHFPRPSCSSVGGCPSRWECPCCPARWMLVSEASTDWYSTTSIHLAGQQGHSHRLGHPPTLEQLGLG